MNLIQEDFTLFKDRQITKVLTFYEEDGVTPINLSNSTIQLIYSNDGFITENTINGSVGGVNNNEGSFVIPGISTEGTYRYKVVEVPNTGDTKPIMVGEIRVLDENSYSTSLDEMIDYETPTGITIGKSYRGIRIYYWRQYLKDLINPSIDIPEIESNWSPLVNFLISKLVVYDFLNLYARKAYLSIFGAEESTTGEAITPAPVKSIETGPTKAEWYDTSKSLESIFKPNNTGESAFDRLKEETCMLARRVRIYLPICNNPSKQIMVPIKAERVKPDNTTDLLNKNFPE